MIHEMKINIKGKEVELKYSIRSLFLFENIMNKSFSLDNTQDTVVYFYCVLMASDKTLALTFEEYLDLLDENPNIIADFAQWLMDVNNINKLSEEELKADGESKK